jgi:diguanylate cyclase (GGDEF)-like protein/PAS domain S-box-containing protein
MSAPASPADARQTAERVRLLYEFSPGGYLLSAVVGVATAVFLWQEISPALVLGWTAFVLLVCAGRYALYLAHKQRAPADEQAPAWERRFTVGSTLMGFAWAALPLLLFPERNIELQLALIFIVAAMAMGGVGILAPSLLALALFLAPMAAATVARLFLHGGAIFIGIGVIALFYVVLLVRMGREFHRALTDAIGTRVVNQRLIDRLRQSQDALSDAIESVPEAIAIYDAEDRMVLCNRKYAQAQTTFDDPAQLVGKSFAELVRLSVAKGEAIEPEFAGNIDAWVAERIRRREAEAGKEPRMYRIGDGRWMLTSISRARGGGIVAVRTDITRLREAEISLKAALDEQELIFEGVTAGIAFVRDRITQRVNGRLAEMFGYAREEMIGKTSQVFYDSEEDWERIGSEAYPLISNGGTYQAEVRGKRRNGESFWMRVTGSLVDPADAAKGSIWVINNVDARHRAEDALKAALLEEQRIMDTATVGIVFLKDRKVVKCNRQFAAMFAYGPDELIGHSSAIWFPSVENWQQVGNEAYAVVERGEPYEFEQEFVRKNGERVWCQVAGRILDQHNWEHGSIWVYTDTTERKRREEEVRALAHHDELTGLPNRRLLDDRIAQAFAAARRTRDNVAVMLLDLDHFKPINDTHGHEAGDQVLRAVAARLRNCVRKADTVARLGGDEFVVMLPMRDAQHAVRVAEGILAALAEPFPVGASQFRLGVSIGISVFPDDAAEKDDLLKFADRAMYAVKASGRNAYRFYAREQAQAQA